MRPHGVRANVLFVLGISSFLRGYGLDSQSGYALFAFSNASVSAGMISKMSPTTP